MRDLEAAATEPVHLLAERPSSAAGRHQTLMANDVLGFPESASVPNVATVTQTSNEMGMTSSLTPPGKAAHGLSYSAIGELTQYTPPLASATAPPGQCAAGAECYQYNVDRQLEDVTLGDGSVVDYAYHSTKGLLTSVNVPVSGITTFGYSTVGRLQTINAPDHGVLSYATQGELPIRETWSGTHQVKDGATTIWTGALNGTVDRTYNNFLELDRLTVAGGFDQRFVRDADGLVTRIDPAATGSSVPSFVIARSGLDGHVTGTTLGTVTTDTHTDISAGNPGYGDLTGLRAVVDGDAVFETAYTRDLLGRITELTETVDGDEKTRRYEYDDAGRLVAVRNENSTLIAEYGYDANGNRTLAHTAAGNVDVGVNLGCPDGEAADEEDRLCTYGDFEYGYDGNGALEVRRRISTGAEEHFVYDGLGRLMKAVVPGKTIHYVNDGQGRRMGKVVNGVLQKGWLYGSALAPIAQLNAAGAVEATFVYGTRPNVPDYIVKTGGGVYRVIADHLGSVRLVVNVSTGAIVQRMDYDEWGNVTSESGDAGLHPFGYAAGMYDRDTKLVRFGARDYDGVTGRWTGKDPIKFVGGDSNIYRYVGSDPINRIDPRGLTVLSFDRQTGLLNVYDDSGALVQSMIASSGRGIGLNNGTFDGVPGLGPIPAGDYALNVSDLTNPGWLGDVARNLGGDWGDWRVPLHPSRETRTRGRSGFYIHGGKRPGSAGCIDVGGGTHGSPETDKLRNEIMGDHDGIVYLHVY